MTLDKFQRLRVSVVPALISRTSKLLEIDLGKDQGVLIEVVDSMDEIVFGDYVQRRAVALSQVIEDGILRSGVDWLNTARPNGEATSSCSGWKVRD